METQASQTGDRDVNAKNKYRYDETKRLFGQCKKQFTAARMVLQFVTKITDSKTVGTLTWEILEFNLSSEMGCAAPLPPVNRIKKSSNGGEELCVIIECSCLFGPNLVTRTLESMHDCYVLLFRQIKHNSNSMTMQMTIQSYFQ